MTNVLFNSARGSKDDGNNSVQNVLDPTNLDTRFSSDAGPNLAFVDLIFNTPEAIVTGLGLAFYKGDDRKTKFVVTYSQDPKGALESEIKPVGTFESSGETNKLQQFMFPEKLSNVKFIRVTYKGDDDDDKWFSVTGAQAISERSGDDKSMPPVKPPVVTPKPQDDKCCHTDDNKEDKDDDDDDDNKPDNPPKPPNPTPNPPKPPVKPPVPPVTPPPPKPPVVPPTPPIVVPGGNLTPLGVMIQGKQIKLNGQSVLEVEYEHSTHGLASGGSQERGSIYAKEKFGFGPINGCIYGYINTTITDEEQRMVEKIVGGEHGKENPKRGCCLGVGLTLGDGTPVFEKEYPEHPHTQQYNDKVVFADPKWTSLGNINGKTIGVQLIYYKTPQNTLKVEYWVDTSVLDKNLDDLAAIPVPPNKWKLFFTAEDKGDLDGEPYLENQGVANGGEAMGFYFRINTEVENSTKFKWMGACEIIP